MTAYTVGYPSLQISIGSHARHLEQIIKGLEGDAPIHIVGHSMGALATLDCAIRHPNRVASLALVGISVPMPVGEAFLAAAADDSPAAFDMQSVWGHARLASLPGPRARRPAQTPRLPGEPAHRPA